MVDRKRETAKSEALISSRTRDEGLDRPEVIVDFCL